jgi:hypothetical protein
MKIDKWKENESDRTRDRRRKIQEIENQRYREKEIGDRDRGLRGR